MVGLLEWEGTKILLVEMTPERLYGLSIVRIKLSKRQMGLQFRLQKMCQLLRQQKITRLLVPESFEHWEFIAGFGMREINLMGFLQYLGGERLLFGLKQWEIDPKKACIAIQGTRVTPQMEQIVLELAPKVRDIAINVPHGGRELADRLHYEFGMAPAFDGKRILATLSFSKEKDEMQKNTVFADKIEEYRGINSKNITILEDTHKLELLCLLWETGKIKKSEIEFT